MLTGKNKTLVYEQAPPSVCKEHYLLLLELYVKQASGDRLTKLNQMFFVPTSVHFGFLDFVNENDLIVTPVDPLFQPQVGIINEVEVFNVGKSVLFAIDSESVMNRAAKMILKFMVKKQIPDAVKPDVLVGTGELDLSGQYAALRIEMIQDWKNSVTTSKEFDGQVPLIYNGTLSGNLDIFVRISGLGPMIITEFDAPIAQDPSTFVFGAGEADQILLYKCREVDSRILDVFEDSCEDLQRPIICPVCIPEKYPCVPCGKLAAVEERNEKMRKKRIDGMTERKLKDISSKGPVQYNRDPSQPCGKPVVLKVSGLFDNGDNPDGKKPTVTVAAESAATKPGDPSDPDHDIFVLRIGKKGLVGIGEKSDIQLEMKTPKGPERRPPIRYETRDMQTEEHDEELPKEHKKKIKKKK
ncbi:PREDICTED: uncharacterized protein LOC108778052 [Cyphomyrmex costatus]|uniref:Uncharacterized protein n=1 Tax=Cyphomyrmex costatus TaxID=456900 RepID=A0A195CCG1_9HYME|nr:PREDICTED: uncharacterized protein LOC108778052 [Cyphomyrmex costatus]KYM97916.1 hypothetical protein ALC62_11262 [Cyphomyrmex costatus]